MRGKKPPIQALVFDVFGTVVDSRPTFAKAGFSTPQAVLSTGGVCHAWRAG